MCDNGYVEQNCYYKYETKGNDMSKQEIQDFTKTLIPNICSIIELSGNEALKDAVKQAIYDRRDAYLNTLHERKRNENGQNTRQY